MGQIPQVSPKRATLWAGPASGIPVKAVRREVVVGGWGGGAGLEQDRAAKAHSPGNAENQEDGTAPAAGKSFLTRSPVPPTDPSQGTRVGGPDPKATPPSRLGQVGSALVPTPSSEWFDGAGEASPR
jgi:hypothetical protein